MHSQAARGTSPSVARSTRVLHGIIAGIAAAAVIGPALVVANSPVIGPAKRVAMPVQRVVPKAEVPQVEPMRFVDLTPDDARALNAKIPFSTAPNPAARPFRFAGGPDDLARATDCMAAGILYEAGDDTLGERAVAQVVLNRLRHPAFPKTVCGVVFEGQDRTTGCQFSFSCDGALARWQPSDDSWRRAHEVATAALSGAVFKPVGYATHYHTDWVVPYWQSSLDKITAVHTHLFFRWSGWWGTPPAFGRHPETREPVIPQLAGLSDAHKTGLVLDEAQAALAEASAAMGFTPPTDSDAAPGIPIDKDTMFVTVSRGATADSVSASALQACGDRPFCRYMAWQDASKLPTTLPLDAAQLAALSFTYLRDRQSNYERALWNCRQFKRADPNQCTRAPAASAAATTPAPAAVDAAPKPAVKDAAATDLNGIRRRTGTASGTAASESKAGIDP